MGSGAEETEDIYNTKNKCQYTGLPFDCFGKCSCFIHSKKSYQKVDNGYVLKKSNSYEILMIEPPITEEELKKAYHKMCLKYHPDKGGCNDKFIEIKNAYDDLLLCC